MLDSYTHEYLNLIQETVDPEAKIDSYGNIVYVDDVDMEVCVVTPEKAKQYLTDMMEG